MRSRGRRGRSGCLGVFDGRNEIGGVASSFNLVPPRTSKDRNRFLDCGITLHWLIEDTIASASSVQERKGSDRLDSLGIEEIALSWTNHGYGDLYLVLHGEIESWLKPQWKGGLKGCFRLGSMPRHDQECSAGQGSQDQTTQMRDGSLIGRSRENEACI